MPETKGLGRLWKRPRRTNRPFESETNIDLLLARRRREMRTGCLFVFLAGVLGCAFYAYLIYRMFP